MVVDVSKDKLILNKLISEKQETIVVQGDMIVPDSKPDILSTLNTSGIVSIYKKEGMNGRVRVDGNINVYIMYLADSAEDKVRGINTNLDFSENFVLSDCTQEMRAELETCIKSIECKVLNGRKINIKVTLNTKIRVYSKEENEVICDINDSNIQVLKPSYKIDSLIGEGTTKAYIKETVMIDSKDNLAELLKVNCKIVDSDIKISYNKVLAKAEVELKMMYLTEDNRISCVTARIPIVGFIDMPNVTENSMCNANYQIKNIIIKPNSIEEHSIYVEIEVEISCEACEQKEINLIEDLYSTCGNLEFNKRVVRTISNKAQRKETLNINERVNVPEIAGRQLIDVDIVPIITKTNKMNSKIMYEGDMELVLTYADESQMQTNTKNVTIPFELTLDNVENAENMNEITNIEVKSNNCKLEGDTVNCNIDLAFDVKLQEDTNLNIIDDVIEAEGEDIQDYSVVIYIVKRGDTLWNIAKRFKSTVDDIARVNGIENPNSIMVGEKLYIPRTVRTSVSYV